ncbi:MAG: hypothetical protein ACI8RZ_004643 [Myxococcota bacterium]|jgi:hypothetical protein
MSDRWQKREDVARQQLAALSFLVGEWEGSGTAGGQPIRGRLSATMRLGETFLEVREQLFLPNGTLDHEDICFYRYDTSQEQLRVLQMVQPAWTAERPVVLLDGGGLRWFDGPLGPQVSLTPTQGGLTVMVRLPDVSQPAVELHYRHA